MTCFHSHLNSSYGSSFYPYPRPCKTCSCTYNSIPLLQKTAVLATRCYGAGLLTYQTDGPGPGLHRLFTFQVRGDLPRRGDKFTCTMTSGDAYVRRSQGKSSAGKAHPLAEQVLGGGAWWAVAVSKVQRWGFGSPAQRSLPALHLPRKESTTSLALRTLIGWLGLPW